MKHTLDVIAGHTYSSLFTFTFLHVAYLFLRQKTVSTWFMWILLPFFSFSGCWNDTLTAQTIPRVCRNRSCNRLLSLSPTRAYVTKNQLNESLEASTNLFQLWQKACYCFLSRKTSVVLLIFSCSWYCIKVCPISHYKSGQDTELSHSEIHK